MFVFHLYTVCGCFTMILVLAVPKRAKTTYGAYFEFFRLSGFLLTPCFFCLFFNVTNSGLAAFTI